MCRDVCCACECASSAPPRGMSFMGTQVLLASSVCPTGRLDVDEGEAFPAHHTALDSEIVVVFQVLLMKGS